MRPVKLKKEARKQIILQEIAKGKKLSRIINELAEDWGLSTATVRGIMYECFQEMEEDYANLKNQNIMRLDGIIEDTMQDKNYKESIKALDVQNKLAGLYTERLNVETQGEVILEFNL